MSGLYVLLVHGPVLGADGAHITTATTPLDITDIARTARTYDVKGFGLIQPEPNQRALIDRIAGFWTSNQSRANLRSRQEALSRARSFLTIEDAIKFWGAGYIVATSAQAGEGDIRYGEIAALAQAQNVYLLLGTGYGLIPEILQNADAIAPAIVGVEGYAHLSVRAAAAILLDRVFRRFPD